MHRKTTNYIFLPHTAASLTRVHTLHITMRIYIKIKTSFHGAISFRESPLHKGPTSF